MDKPWAIKEIGRLGLGYISKVTNIYADRNGKTRLETKLCGIEDGLEIYMWAEDFSCRWVIASLNSMRKSIALNCVKSVIECVIPILIG